MICNLGDPMSLRHPVIVLQCDAVMQHPASHCNRLQYSDYIRLGNTLQYSH